MRGIWKALIWIVVILGALFGAAYGLFFTIWTVTEEDPRMPASMIPNLAVGDVVFVSRGTGVRLGWLVRCTNPVDSGSFVVGRVVGVANEKIKMDSGQLAINSHRPSSVTSCTENPVPIFNPATGSNSDGRCVFEEIGASRHEIVSITNAVESPFETQVSGGNVFLLSDDRTLHYDSRDYGQVDPNTCQHLIFRVYGETGWSDAAHRLTLLY